MNQTVPRLASSTGALFASPLNPYQAPAADDAPPSHEGGGVARRATRGERWLAAMIDSFISLATVVPLQIKFGVYRNFPLMRPLGFGLTVLWGAIGMGIWFVVNGYFLTKNAQTIGKRLVGIRIEDHVYARPAEVWRLAFLRYLPTAAMTVIPKVGPFLALLDVLLIFRKDRRCLHDHIAGTVVVKV